MGKRVSSWKKKKSGVVFDPDENCADLGKTKQKKPFPPKKMIGKRNCAIKEGPQPSKKNKTGSRKEEGGATREKSWEDAGKRGMPILCRKGNDRRH